MVGFLVGAMIGVLLGAFIICCLVVGDDEIDSYHKIIETYDKEVDRQYKVIKKVSKYIKSLLEINEKYKEQFKVGEEQEWYSPKWLEQTCNEMLAVINDGDDKE